MLLLLLACRAEPESKPPDTHDTAPIVEDGQDADGYSIAEGDCDDGDASINPGADERCDGIDNDCDDAIDEGVTATFYADEDGDGFGDPATAAVACSGATEDGSDCDDTRADVHPTADEPCDGVDNDCDDAIDENGVSTWYTDADGDGFGAPGTGELGCSPEGRVATDTDCDDTRATTAPGADEACNAVDDDCDGAIDEGVTTTWYIDHDGDGYGSAAYTLEECTAPTGYVGAADDCDDTVRATNPGATELCNDADDDCDGTVDEDDAADAPTWYLDADGDGWGLASGPYVSCAQPAGYAAVVEDCDDADPSINPGAVEVCSATVDQDCDGITSELCLSCLDYLEEAGTASDGLYTIDPDGAGPLATAEVWCDMSTDGGGWTLIQRTVWDWAETSLLDTGFSAWAGSTVGDPDAGQVFRLAGEAWSALDTNGEILAVHVARDDLYASDCDPLYYQGTNSTFTVSATDATVSTIASTATLVNSTDLSTADSGPSEVCVDSYDAIPWFYSNCCTTCPSFFGGYWTDQAHPMAYYLDYTVDLFGATTADVCPSRAAESTSGYDGVNTMEIYLR